MNVSLRADSPQVTNYDLNQKDAEGRSVGVRVERTIVEIPGAIINIGLSLPGGDLITPVRAAQAIENAGVRVRHQAVHFIGTGHVLVAILNRALTDAEARAVAEALEQPYISQCVFGQGALHGPQAPLRTFQPESFLTLSGAYLPPFMSVEFGFSSEITKDSHVDGHLTRPQYFATYEAREAAIKGLLATVSTPEAVPA